jgi:hypothetical protein
MPISSCKTSIIRQVPPAYFFGLGFGFTSGGFCFGFDGGAGDGFSLGPGLGFLSW